MCVCTTILRRFSPLWHLCVAIWRYASRLWHEGMLLHIGRVLSSGMFFASCLLAAAPPGDSFSFAYASFALTAVLFHVCYAEAFFLLGLLSPAIYIITVILLVVNPGHALSHRVTAFIPPALFLLAAASANSYYRNWQRVQRIAQRNALIAQKNAHIGQQVDYMVGTSSDYLPPSQALPGYTRESSCCFSWLMNMEMDLEEIGRGAGPVPYASLHMVHSGSLAGSQDSDRVSVSSVTFSEASETPETPETSSSEF